MVQSALRSRAGTARKYLAGAREVDSDSDDALSIDASGWQWIYGDAAVAEATTSWDKVSQNRGARKRKASAMESLVSERRVVGARRGRLECRVGDTLLLQATGNEYWVALLCHFSSESGGLVASETGRSATFMWFASPNEIRNKAKRRTDFLPNERYITADIDENSLDTVCGKATVMSRLAFETKYRTVKAREAAMRSGKVFICQRGCNTRTATYTEKFMWEDVLRGSNDLALLKERVEKETNVTRKCKPQPNTSAKPDHSFALQESFESQTTPKKRRKADDGGTPKSKKATIASPKLNTPTHKRFIPKQPLEFTPLGTRTFSPSQVFSSPFQKARSQLHVSSIPSMLPCREDEFSTVYTYLESAITEGTGSCIYISGTPGTGKTATVREVVSQLNTSVQADELDDFIYVEINGMKVTDPHQSYSLLWEALTGDRLSPAAALCLLEREFSNPSPRRVPCVVLMDELDQLVTKNQSVMYNFFNWPSLSHSRLIVVAVANTMDLPERTLSNKISSRLGLTRVNFPVYSHEQLIKIIQSRLEGVPGKVMEQDAIQFASRKVAQVSGDARRALDICRRAVELAEVDVEPIYSGPLTPSKKGTKAQSDAMRFGKRAGHVTIGMVQQAIREATTSPLQQYLRCLPISSKIFLAALLARTRRTGVIEGMLGDVVDEAKRIGKTTQLMPIHDFLLFDGSSNRLDGAHSKSITEKTNAPRILAMGSAAMDLMEAGILMLESRKGDRAGRFRLSIGQGEIKLAFKDDAEIRELGFAV